MKRGWLILGALALAVLLLALGYLGGQHTATSMLHTGATASTHVSKRKVQYWYDPMLPGQHFDHPGMSPMGMQLVPKYAEAGARRDIVHIDPATLQNLGVHSERAKVGRLADTLHVPGTIAWDQRLAVVVSARTPVTIEKLYVRAPYTAVKAGEPLADVLAPQWSAAAAEYFALRNAHSDTARALLGAARARLHVLGLDDATIRGLRAGSAAIVLRAPINGVVSQLNAREGQQLGADMPILSLNGLDTVWVDAAIPQAQSGGIQAGTPIVATVNALPGKTWHGTVEQLLPDVDATTRTRRARIVLDNPQHQLVPGMYVDLRIKGASGAPHPLVPVGAVIADGRDTRVIQALGGGRFRPVRVRTGRSSGGMTEILAGLHGGERIVTSGQFLIDSEASLSGALQRLGSSAHAKPAPGSTSGSAAPTNSMPGMAMPPASASSHAPAKDRMSGMHMGKAPRHQP